MKAIILARVSTEDQREAGNSLPAQITRMESYCERKDFEIVKTFSFDESAYKDKRDEFDKILEYLEKNTEKIAVCFDKVDRLSRNVFDKRVSKLYEKAVADEIELHFVSDGQVINAKISAAEKFNFGMSLGLAKYYSDAISDNVKRALEQKRRNGEWIGKPPIGYKNVTDINDKKDIVPDLQSAHLVTKMFELYATGNYSYETIRKEMSRLGLLSRAGKKLSTSTIEITIKNSFYYGIADSPTYGRYPHKYEKLITKDVFDRCQDVRIKRKKQPSKEVGQAFIFQGLLKCDDCGCAYSPEHKVKPSGLEYNLYSCTNSKKICKRIYVNEKELLKPVYSVLERFESISEQTQEEILAELRKATEMEVEFHKAQVNRIRQEQDKYTERKDGLLDLLLDQSITKAQYDKKMQEFSDKLQNLNIEFEEHTKADCDYQTTVATVFSLARRAKQIFDGSEINEQRAFLNYLFQNPTVKEKTLVFTLRSPFDLVLQTADQPVMQG